MHKSIAPNILLTKDYSSFSKLDQKAYNWSTYVKYIKREQKFFKHLLFRLMGDIITHKELGINAHSRVMVYIHAGLGERKNKDYEFCSEGSPRYKELIHTDDWDDIGPISHYMAFYYNYDTP